MGYSPEFCSPLGHWGTSVLTLPSSSPGANLGKGDRTVWGRLGGTLAASGLRTREPSFPCSPRRTAFSRVLTDGGGGG